MVGRVYYDAPLGMVGRIGSEPRAVELCRTDRADPKILLGTMKIADLHAPLLDGAIARFVFDQWGLGRSTPAGVIRGAWKTSREKQWQSFTHEGPGADLVRLLTWMLRDAIRRAPRDVGAVIQVHAEWEGE